MANKRRGHAGASRLVKLAWRWHAEAGIRRVADQVATGGGNGWALIAGIREAQACYCHRLAEAALSGFWPPAS